MRTQVISCTLFVLALLVCQVAAQPAPTLLPPLQDKNTGGKEQPKDPGTEKEKDKGKKVPDKKLTEPPTDDIFASPFTRSSDFPTFFNPNMMGDWPTIIARQTRVILGTQTAVVTTTVVGDFPTKTTTTTMTTPFAQARTVLVSVPTRGSFKIAENESAIPRDRVFTYWNYYSNVGFRQTGLNAPITTTNRTMTTAFDNQLFTTTTTGTTVTTMIPGAPAPRVSSNRETFGFEKTFLDGYASVELRAPLLQQGDGGAGFGADNFGDLTIIGKYAFFFDRNTGNVLSGGLAITVPSSRSIPTTDGNLQDTLIQPFAGYLWNFDQFYIQGFHSVAVPTDARDVTLLFNDLGVNYWLYRGSPDRPLSSVVPTIEAHLTTPLNHRNFDGPIVVRDTLILTGGVHLGMFRSSTLSLGVATPVTGTHLFNVETFLQFNWRF
jgi:hypothetical protein